MEKSLHCFGSHLLFPLPGRRWDMFLFSTDVARIAGYLGVRKGQFSHYLMTMRSGFAIFLADNNRRPPREQQTLAARQPMGAAPMGIGQRSSALNQSRVVSLSLGDRKTLPPKLPLDFI